MLVAYALLVLAGVVITVRAARKGTGHPVLAVAGTVLSMLAILTGFSIGPLVAVVAAALLIIAGTSRGHRDRVS